MDERGKVLKRVQKGERAHGDGLISAWWLSWAHGGDTGEFECRGVRVLMMDEIEGEI